MKTIIIVLLALVMAFALIPMGVAGIGSANAQGSRFNVDEGATVASPSEFTCQGAYHFGPATPVPMGTVGGAAAG